MNDIINKHFNNYNFDLRITKDGRFIDQKVTPDVLTVIAEAILYWSNLTASKVKFTTKDLWELDYLNQTVKNLFSKPSMDNENAKSEYDKFIQQPLKMLSAAKILNCSKFGRTNYFEIQNNEILEYISIKERNALEFIIIYLEKVLKDSDIYTYFESFFSNPNKNTYKNVKDKYIEFIKYNTNIKGNLEPKRIFTKVINPLAFKNSCNGSERGYISKNIIKYTDLMYNRINFRDVNKGVSETRAEYEDKLQDKIVYSDVYKDYIVQKSKRLIRKLHGNISEVKDELSIGIATQVHHIFPVNEYPEISAYLENLILLTPSQHFTKAHENNYTMYINKQYQYICLLAKLDTIKEFINKNDLRYYTKENYIYVISVGTETNLSPKMNLKEIQEYLFEKYSDN